MCSFNSIYAPWFQKQGLRDNSKLLGKAWAVILIYDDDTRYYEEVKDDPRKVQSSTGNSLDKRKPYLRRSLVKGSGISDKIVNEEKERKG